MLANDTDADGNLDTNSVVVLTPPANGAVTTNLPGRLTYTPAFNFNGTNSFTYRVGKAQELSNFVASHKDGDTWVYRRMGVEKE